MSNKKILITCVAVFAVAAVGLYFIFATEPTAKSDPATKKIAMLVEIDTAQAGNFRPEILATGTVQAVEDLILSPLVEGQVIKRDPEFVPGGFVEKGDLLLQIDPSDYRNALQLSRSEVLQAQTDLDVEMGRQQVAKKDLALIGGDSLSPEERALVLRKPQLDAVKARLQAARAAVNQAQTELERTAIRAPFDAHVITQNVSIGSQVAPGDNLGRLVGTDHYWVYLNVPVQKLKWLKFPDAPAEEGSPVKIRNTTAWPEDTFRTGYLEKRVGALDEETRLANVLVRVPDPLGKGDQPPLMIESFVEARLLGEEIQDVVRLDRDLVRRGQTVWVMEEGLLQVRDVEILLSDAQYAYISSGLGGGEKIVTTNISTVTDGIPLRTADSIAETNQQ